MAQERTLGRALGAFGFGLGLIELAAPDQLAQWIGIEPGSKRSWLVRGLGARELAASGPLVGMPGSLWTWMRVAGDAMDLTLLAAAANTKGVRRDRLALVLAAVAGVTVLDIADSVLLSRAAGELSTQIRVRKSVTIDRPREQVYDYWRDLENLPSFMQHLEEVRETGGMRSHWRAKGPARIAAEWDAEIIQDDRGRSLAWRSVEGSRIGNFGTVRFEEAPGGRGTEVHVDLHYEPPAGPVGRALAGLFHEAPAQQIADDLRHLKAVLETGEVVESEPTFGGRTVRQRPGRPSDTPVSPDLTPERQPDPARVTA